MRILVTGGAGYIGSVTSAELINQNHEVVVFDNLSKGHKSAVSPGAKLVIGDIRDEELVKATLIDNKIEAVMHFAALSLVGESVSSPDMYYDNNLRGSLCLLNSMRVAGCLKFILSSTAAVYGNPEKTPIKEEFLTCPTNPYGETKLAIEKVLKWYEGAFGLSYVSLRYFNAAGAVGDLGEDHEPETHLIPLVLKTAMGKRESITVFGDDYPTPDGTCVRDYIAVPDLAMAHILALKTLETKSAIYNLGNGQSFSVKEVIETAREVTGLPIKTETGPRRAGDPAVLVADSCRACAELGWDRKTADLREIIAGAWSWHQKYPDGYPD
jgi:UDP-glucose 4-epimerase